MTRTAPSTIAACWGRRRLWRKTTGTNRISRFANPLQRSLRMFPHASRSECKLPQGNGEKNLSPPKVGDTSDYPTVCRDPAVAGRPSKGAFARVTIPPKLSTPRGRRTTANLPPFAENTDVCPAINQKSAIPCLAVVNPNTSYSVNILLSSVLSRLSPMLSPKGLLPIPRVTIAISPCTNL